MLENIHVFNRRLKLSLVTAVSEMTYTVSSVTLNSSIPYRTW